MTVTVDVVPELCGVSVENTTVVNDDPLLYDLVVTAVDRHYRFGQAFDYQYSELLIDRFLYKQLVACPYGSGCYSLLPIGDYDEHGVHADFFFQPVLIYKVYDHSNAFGLRHQNMLLNAMINSIAVSLNLGLHRLQRDSLMTYNGSVFVDNTAGLLGMLDLVTSQQYSDMTCPWMFYPATE